MTTSMMTRALAQTRSRRLTVGYLPALWPELTPSPKPMPYLRLLGRWLEAAGFPVGSPVRAQVEPQRLILEVIDSGPTEPQMSRARVNQAEASVDSLA